MKQFLVVASILFLSIFYWGPDFHGSRMLAALGVASLWISGIVWRRVNWTAGLFFCWTLLSGFRVFTRPGSPFQQYGDYAVFAADAISAAAVVSVFAVLLPLLFADHRTIKSITRAFGLVCIADSLMVITQWVLRYDSFDRGGFFGNASMNACVIAVTYPILIRPEKWEFRIWPVARGLANLCLPILAVLVSRSNMALAALIAGIIAPQIVDAARDGKMERISMACFISGILIVAGHYFMGQKFGENSGRFPVWRAALHWWWAHANHFVGTGLGTYFILGPNVQRIALQASDGFLLWMHNDWLQILFEQGIVGLSLAVLMVAFAARACVRSQRYWLLSSIAAYSVTMMGNFPMHLPIPGFLGAFLIVAAFRGDVPIIRCPSKRESR